MADTDGVLKAVPATSLGGEWEDDGAGGIRAVQANASGNTFAFKDDGDIFVGRNGFDLADKENIVTEFRASTDNLDPASTQEAQFFTTRSRVKQSSVNGAISYKGFASELDATDLNTDIPGLIGISTGLIKRVAVTLPIPLEEFL